MTHSARISGDDIILCNVSSPSVTAPKVYIAPERNRPIKLLVNMLGYAKSLLFSL